MCWWASASTWLALLGTGCRSQRTLLSLVQPGLLIRLYIRPPSGLTRPSDGLQTSLEGSLQQLMWSTHPSLPPTPHPAQAVTDCSGARAAVPPLRPAGSQCAQQTWEQRPCPSCLGRGGVGRGKPRGSVPRNRLLLKRRGNIEGFNLKLPSITQQGGESSKCLPIPTVRAC